MELESLKLKTKAGETLDLSIEEARELYNQLHSLFGSNYVPSTPIYIDRTMPSSPTYWLSDTTCKNYGTTGLDITFKGKE